MIRSLPFSVRSFLAWASKRTDKTTYVLPISSRMARMWILQETKDVNVAYSEDPNPNHCGLYGLHGIYEPSSHATHLQCQDIVSGPQHHSYAGKHHPAWSAFDSMLKTGLWPRYVASAQQVVLFSDNYYIPHTYTLPFTHNKNMQGSVYVWGM